MAALLLCAFALSPLRLGAATNDLSGLLQKGLFEEEANRNLDAAVQAYQALVTAFDQDRKLAATAVFRLGECYRKLGKTNEAVLQYGRIVREFTDEPTLATLSRQYLASLGILPTKAPTGAVEGGEEGLEWSVTKARKEVASTEQELAMMEKTKKDDPQFLPVYLSAKDDELRNLLRLRGEKKRRLEALKVSYATEHPEVKVAQAELDSTANAINKRVDGMMTGCRVRLQSQREALAEVEKQAPGSTARARQEQKRLLEAEIKLAEVDLAEVKTQVEVGRATQHDLRAKERDILQLRRQLVGLDDGDRTMVQQDDDARELAEGALSVLRNRNEKIQQDLKVATKEVDNLRVSLAVPVEVAVISADKGIDDPRLAKYRAYFAAKHEWENLRQFAQVLQMKLTSEETNVLLQHGAREASRKEEAAKPLEKP